MSCRTPLPVAALVVAVLALPAGTALDSQADSLPPPRHRVIKGPGASEPRLDPALLQAEPPAPPPEGATFPVPLPVSPSGALPPPRWRNIKGPGAPDPIASAPSSIGPPPAVALPPTEVPLDASTPQTDAPADAASPPAEAPADASSPATEPSLEPESPPGEAGPSSSENTPAALLSDVIIPALGESIERVSGSFKFTGQYRHSDVEGSPRQETALLREVATARVQGRIYNDRFLRYDLAGSIGPAQGIELAGFGDVGDSILLGYDVSARILPEHPATLGLFARRYEDIGFARFLDSFGQMMTRSEEVGSRLDVRLAPIRAGAALRRFRSSTEGADTDRADERTEFDADVHYDPDSRTRANARLDLNSVHERAQDDETDYETMDLAVGCTLEAGDLVDRRPQFVFQTDAGAREQSGDLDLSDRYFSEDVVWRLSDALESRTRFAYRGFSSGLTESSTYDVGETLVHRLYQSLVTTLSADWSRTDLVAGEIERLGGAIDVAYRKNTDVGVLRVDLRGGLTREWQSGSDEDRLAIDESHTLSTTGFELLQQIEVDPASVVVTDGSGSTLYVRGADYELLARGDRLEIVRIPGGRIPEGGAVLVDYAYPSLIRGTTDRRTFGAGASLRLFDCLDVYYRFAQTRQDGARDVDDSRLEQSRTHRVGVRFARGGTSGTAEFIDHESNSSPYREARAEAQQTFDLGERSRASVGGSFVRTSFDEGEDLLGASVRARWETAWGGFGRLTVEPGFRWEEGRGADRSLLDVRAEASYRFRAFDLRLAVEYQHGLLSGNQRSETLVTLGVERIW